jgi:hypothetical protein
MTQNKLDIAVMPSPDNQAGYTELCRRVDEIFARIKAHSHFDIDAPARYLLSLRRVQSAR